MSIEMSYVLITPYSIVKSRTGGIISRLLSRSELDLVGAQIFAPDENFVNEYADSLLDYNLYNNTKENAKMLSDYVRTNLMPSDGRKHRTMLLLFKGENAVEKLFKVCGSLFDEDFDELDWSRGETVRDTFADLVWTDKKEKNLKYFEPAVLIPRTMEATKENLLLFSKYIKNMKNIVENVRYKNPDKIERTLVIIKPDNWTYSSSRPGSIVDMFSRTGLRIIGCKIFRMSVNQALEFYGPVKDVLVGKLSSVFGGKAATLLEENFKMKLDEETIACLNDSFGKSYALDQFYQIIEFMSGSKPNQIPESEWDNPGKVKCMILIYEGENSVSKIREVLGPTDPTKAPSGTIRKEFGHNVMVNSAHASDSTDNAKREMRITKIDENPLCNEIDNFFK